MTKIEKLLIVALRAVRRMDKVIDKLDKLGFDIDRGVAGELAHEADKTEAEIEEALELKRVSGYTTISWWREGMLNGQPYTERDADGVEHTPTTPEELVELMKMNEEFEDTNGHRNHCRSN